MADQRFHSYIVGGRVLADRRRPGATVLAHPAAKHEVAEHPAPAMVASGRFVSEAAAHW
jgi:hypothetical protein